jgi:hypothetical protein
MTHRVKVALLRGPEFYWRTACEFTRQKGGFTVAELAGCTSGVTNAAVQKWVMLLKRQGELKVVGARPAEGARFAADLYAVVRIRSQPPIAHKGEPGIPGGQVQKQLWSAMRALESFSSQELAVSASTEECPVTRTAAVNYIRFLSRAGMLVVLQEPTPRKGRRGTSPGRWRLVRAHNRGPHAPQILHARFVFDPNRDEIIGESEVFA